MEIKQAVRLCSLHTATLVYFGGRSDQDAAPTNEFTLRCVCKHTHIEWRRLIQHWSDEDEFDTGAIQRRLISLRFLDRVTKDIIP